MLKGASEKKILKQEICDMLNKMNGFYLHTVYVSEMSHNRDLSRKVCSVTTLWCTRSAVLHVQPNRQNVGNVCF